MLLTIRDQKDETRSLPVPVLTSLLEAPGQRGAVLARTPVIFRRDQRPRARSPARFFCIPCTQTPAVVRVIDIAPDPISQRAAYQNVRKVMLLAGEAGDADCAGNPISRNLNQRTIVIFVGNHGRQRPCFDAVSRGKRRSPGEEITTILAGKWTAALRDFLERSHYDRAINQSFSSQQTGLARAVVMIHAPEEIEGQGHSADSIT